MTDEPIRLNPDAPRQYTMSGFEVDFFVMVYCSDRGQHEPVLLTTARRELGGGHGMNHALEWFAAPATSQEEADEFNLSRSSYDFRCPRCRRNPRIDRHRWWSLIDAAAVNGLGSIDLSLLPY